MILTGKRFEFILFLTTFAIMWFYMQKAAKGNPPTLRPIHLIEEIDSIVGRASEMGRPIHFSTGSGGLHDQYAVMCVSGLAILGLVAEYCGKYGVHLQYTCFKGYLVPIGQDIIKTGYEKGGRPEMYSPDMVTYTGEAQKAFIAYLMEYFMRERPAAAFMVGAISGEMNNHLMMCARTGAVCIAGTPRIYYQGKIALMADYGLLGEELYVAGAVITKDPVHLGSIEGEDWLKIVVIGLLVLAAIIVTAGKPELFTSLVKW